MPISDFRSAASMTKIITISRMPAPMEKRPRRRKKVVMKLPISSASSTDCALVLSICSGMDSENIKRAISASAAGIASSVSRTPPFTETGINDT